MNKRFTPILFGLALILLVVVLRWPNIRDLVSGDAFPEPGFTWQHHWAEAEKLSQEQNKPLLVVFSASWCPPCKMMKRQVWPDAAVGQAVNANYIPLYIDVDEQEHAEKVAQYKVTGIPYVVILDSSGSIVRQSNTMSAEETLDFLK